MFGVFAWVRKAMKAAILGGVQDAMDELTTGEVDGQPPQVTLRLAFKDKPEEGKKRRAE